MKKRILSIVLSIVMLVSLLPTTAWAVEGDSSLLTKVIVGGVDMYSADGATYYVNGATEAVTGTEPVNWNAKYENGILTIKNLSVVGAAADHKYAGIYATTALTIDVQGANSVTGAENSVTRDGIYIDGALTIRGNGALSVTGGTATSGGSFGISTTSGNNISITENVVVNATGGTAGASNGSGGISCGGTLSIEGNATVNATGGSAGNTYGIYSKYMTVTGGVTVATGGTASGSALTSYGISISSYNDATVTTTGGVLVARAGSGETTKAINGTLTTNDTKVAGGAADSTAVVIVPDSWVDGSSLNFANGVVNLDKDYYIVNDGKSALKLNADTAINTNGYTLLAVSLHSGDASDFGINGSFSASASGSVIAVAGTGVNSTGTGGLGIMGDLTVDGATVTAIGGPGGSGVYGKYNDSPTDPAVKVLSGTLNAIGGSNGNTSHGIEVSRSIVVSGGVVNAVGGRAANGEGYGIMGDLQITGGVVNAVSGPSSATSYGVRGDVTATGGVVNAVGGPSSTNSYGIYISKNMSISNTSKVTATGGTYGLYTSHSLAAGSLAAGSYSGGSNAVKNSVSQSTANALLANGYGYFAGDEQLTSGSTTVGDPYQVVTVKEIPHSHYNCGVANCTDSTHNHSEVTEWVELTSSDLSNGTLSLADGKSYYLGEDITVASEVAISDTVNLCLNGHTISAAGGYFDVSGTLNLCSCKDNGIIKRTTTTTTTTTNALISADNGATANLYNVTLDGGAVWEGTDTVLERGTTNSGISSSAPLIDAGGETTDGGFVVLMNCELRNNVCSGAGEGGAITVGRQGRLTATNTKVYNNAKTAKQAGAIKAYIGATVTLTGCELYGNEAVTHGGAIQIWGGSSRDTIVHMTMTDCTVRNNKAGEVGGGIAVSDYSSFTMNGGTIKDNATTDYYKRGGGVGFGDKNTAMSISGNAVISGNVAGINANNLYIGNNSCNTVTVGEMKNGANIGVTMANSSGGVFTNGGASYAAQFKSDNVAYKVVADGDNLKLVTASTTIYTVTYKTADDSSTLGPVEVAAGEYTLPACTFTPPAGKQFKGWATEANGGVITTATISVSRNTTLYAIWEHVHDYTYIVNTENAAQVIESCTCGHSETATLELDTSVSTVYTGSAIKALKVTYSSGWAGDKNAEISYTNNTNAGTASGSVTIGGLTVTKSFTISKANQGVFAITGKPTGDIAYGGSFTLSTAGGSGGGAVSWAVTSGDAYAKIDSTGKVTIKGVGEVTITATKAESANYNVASDAYTFTSVKATPVLGTVAVSGTVTDTTAPAGVVLTKTAGPEGTFVITDAAMLANKAVYSYTFTPYDTTNYNTVTGTVQIDVKDTQVPSATIKVDTKEWKEKLNGITFGIFFKNRQTVTITYADNENGSGLKDKLYFVADKELTETELADVEWKNYGTAFNIDPDGKFVIYAKVSDNDGNDVTVNSNGIVLDETQAVIEGVTNGGIYYGNVTITVSDALAGVKEVKVDGEAVTLSDGKYTIVADNAEYIVTATDKAGNATEYKITVFKNYTVTYKVDGNTVSTQTVGHGKDATAPTIPEKEGYTQTAPVWDKDGTNITADTEINAVYTINKYTVTYKADGQAVDTQTIEHGANATPPTVPAKVGYTQTPPTWDNDGKNITADIEINALYTINKYTVTYVADEETISTQTIEHGADATVPAIPTKEGYTQTAPYWDKDGKNITTDTEINAVYTINKYNVTFNSNGGNKVEGIDNVNHGTVITASTAPTKENATFAGWFSDSDCTKAWNFAKDTVTADLTLYAKWSDVPDVFYISGKVLEKTGDGENEKVTVSGATVELKLGTTLIATETTDENGLFYFGGQKAGDYNVVVTSGDKVVTVLVTLRDHDEVGLTVELPQTVTNSIVEHKNDKGENASENDNSMVAGTLVGGLEKVAATVRGENQSAQKVEVKLTVKDTPPVTGTPTAGTEAAKQQAQQKAIQQKAGGKQLVFFDLSVMKTINNGAPVAITDTGATLLEIRIPFDSGNKWGITIYRYHGDKAEALAAVNEGSTTEGFWVGDDGYIHIYTHKFSTYAVGYTVPSYGYFVPITPDTVTSADTFDAGIVVYVTMSMLAATGSAVVIGKKRKEEN